MKSKDLFIRRSYEHKGVNIVVDVDYVKRTITIVQKQQNGTFKPAKFTFQDRTLEYMKGWQSILDAIKAAVTEATKLLDAQSEKELEGLVELFLALDKHSLDWEVKKKK